MKNLLLLVLSITCLSQFASADGIDFKKLNWEENLKTAQAENKLIYIDFYTTWCGPCKYMAKKFFTDKEIGNYFNEHFYALKVDAEKEGIDLAKKYGVNGYPTNLFIDPSNEKIIYKTIGSPQEKNGFLQTGVTALEEKNDPMSLEDYEQKLDGGEESKKFLAAYLEKMERLDLPNHKPLDAYSKKYFKKNIDSVEIQFMKKYLKSIDNKTFAIYAANEKSYNAYQDSKGYKRRWSDELSSKLYYTNQIAKRNKDEVLFNKCIQCAEKLLPPYDKLQQSYYLKGTYYEAHDKQKNLENEYEYANNLLNIGDGFYKANNSKMLASVMMQLEMQSQTWPENYKVKLDSFKTAYAANPEHSHRMTMMASQHLNTQAWDVFEQKDSKRYTQALAWANKGWEQAKEIKLGETAVADTYANLLFVTGSKKKAIEIEKWAIKRAKELEEDSKGYEKTLANFVGN